MNTGTAKAEAKGAKSKQPKKQVDQAASKVKGDPEGNKSKAATNPQKKVKVPKTSE